MRLKSLKLAGFKSFVDPTTVHFPSNLVGIVGPNGCGKSNIVDAIRWVMGESSAKQLRGESMSDVIFNGSSGRKPVGQAMVELVFDNSDASLGGEYAKYAEIAIKRQVSREGQSDYYLNGAKCRRKDIIDIFLGTGLGPNSYSVIEQGMISRFIEAKPDELRMYLEEAAGVSKYKERRRETETRIRHTRENLERLEDVRLEITKQLDVLRRQAANAEKYKVLKEEERLTKAQSLALQWQQLKTHSAGQEKIIAELTVEIEARVADQRRVGAELETTRETQIEANESFNDRQGRFYALGAEIATLEQSIKHHRERLAQLEQDRGQVEQNWNDLQAHVDIDQNRIRQFAEELNTLQPSLETARQEETQKTENLKQAEAALTQRQTQWEGFNQTAAETLQKARVEQTRIQHLEQQIVTIEKRLERITLEQNQINFATIDQQIQSLTEAQNEANQSILSAQAQLSASLDQLTAKRQTREQLTQSLDDVRNRLQSARGRHASLTALQQAAQGSGVGSAQHWLQEHQLSNKARLALQLDVTAGWELAVETAINPYLEAICVEDSSDFSGDSHSLKEGEVILFDKHQAPSPLPSSNEKLLAHYVKSDYPIQSLLSGIYCAEDMTEAMRLRNSLPEGGSVITRDGLWLGRHWLRMSKTQDLNNSIIKREKELNTLSQQLKEYEADKERLETELDTEKTALHEFETNRDGLQRNLDAARDQLNKVVTQLAVQRSTRERLSQRSQQLDIEGKEQQPLLQEAHAQLVSLRDSWQAAVTQMEQDEAVRNTLTAERTASREQVDTERAAARLAQDKVHQLTLRIESLHTQNKLAHENLERMRQQLTHLEQRRTELSAALNTQDSPLEGLELELQTKLQSRLEAETELQAARKRVEDVTDKLHQLESQRDQFAAEAEKLRAQLQQLQIDLQSDTVRATLCDEQIAALEYHRDTIIAELPTDSSLEATEQALQSLLNRIARLGAINLLAIEEVVVQEERARYLDAQFKDLNEALTTLEEAIRKIDQETKTRFEETFNIVNNRFKELFPRIFGGGSAYLELTGDDLLSTGIMVMANPPGKKNASIHLLSGGEKALTAVSLVFAIFQLNPAPFCLLDEVDAPLDDSNVIRFCNLVREMSTQVQFMFISHNKIAIEMADHLTGVTMHEAGVSRIVAVDVQEAVALATA
jgi:chromosome segregation protein